MMTCEEIRKMQNVDIRTVDPETLADIKDVTVDTNLSKQECMEDFVRQIRNPYCYRCGKVVVKISYIDTTDTLEDRMESFLKSLC